MKKSIVIAMALALVILAGNCSTRPVNLVRIPVQSSNAINFLKYKMIAYDKVTVENFKSDYDPDPVIDYFFLNDLPKTLQKPIKRYNPAEIKQGTLKEGDLLVVGGKISLDIRERNVIDDSKERKGARVFVKVENWELKFNVFFRDAATGKDLFVREIKDSFKNADRNKPDFTFEYLFKNVTEKLIRLFMGVGRLEVRYLMK